MLSKPLTPLVALELVLDADINRAATLAIAAFAASAMQQLCERLQVSERATRLAVLGAVAAGALVVRVVLR